MHDIFSQIGGYVSIGWRNRWAALVIAWGACMVGWVVVERIPDSYQSSAQVFVDTESMVRDSMRGIAANFDNNLSTQLAFLRESLVSRPNMEEVMRRTDLDLQASNRFEREQIINNLSANLSVSGGGRSSFYSISYTAGSPQLAHDVVQAVLDIFVESNLGSNREELETTSSFLERQIQERENEIANLQQTLRQFEITNREYLSEGGSYETQLQSAETTLFALEGEKVEAESRLGDLNNELNELLRKIRSGDIVSTELASRANELESTLTELLTIYTDEHPDVIITKAQLERERERLRQIAENGDAGAEIDNPVVNELRASVRSEEARIAMLADQVGKLQSRISLLRENVGQIPAIASEADRMTRNLAVAQSNLARLVERREQARYAQRLDVETSSIEFRIINPPTRPLSPAAPNRTLMRGGVFAAGLGGGAAIAAGLGILLGTISSRAQLQHVINRPVIGSVRRTQNQESRRRFIIESAAFWGLAAILILALGVVNLGALSILQPNVAFGI